MNPFKNRIFWILGLVMLAINIPDLRERYGDIPSMAIEGAWVMVGFAILWFIGALAIDLFKEIADRIEKENLRKKHEEEAKEYKRKTEVTTSEPNGSDIGARLKKLRKMYKDGILSKVEFEKAKNKLLK